MKTSNVVLVGVIAALPFLVPIALHPASASDTIFHSSSGIAVVVAGALVALIYYANAETRMIISAPTTKRSRR